MSGYVKGNLRGADLLPCLHQVKWLEEERGAGAAEEEADCSQFFRSNWPRFWQRVSETVSHIYLI